MNMKTIPVYDFPKGKLLPKFEVMPWNKDVSAYDATLPHRHNYYEMLIFLKGKGSHEIDFTTYTFKPHSLHFVASNGVHLVKREQGSEGFSILFTQEFLPSQYSLHDFSFYKANTLPVLNLSRREYITLKPLLDELKSEYFSDNKLKREALASLFHFFLVKVQRLYEQKAGAVIAPVKNDFVAKMEALIEANFAKHWRAGDYAREMNVSVANMTALCKQHFSKNTEKLVQERLLLEIKRQLVYSDKPVKEICYELNFEDPAYFIRFFRKNTGNTPLNYRNALKH